MHRPGRGLRDAGPSRPRTGEKGLWFHHPLGASFYGSRTEKGPTASCTEQAPRATAGLPDRSKVTVSL